MMNDMAMQNSPNQLES